MPEKRTKKSNAPAAATKTAASDDDMPRPIGMTDTTMPAPGMGRGSASTAPGAAAPPGEASPPIPEMVSEAVDTMPRPQVPAAPAASTTMPNPDSPKVAAAMPVPDSRD